MKTLQTRLHPGVVPGHSARQRGSSAHLRQGALEDAAGPYAVFMALIVLGIAPRSHVLCVHEVEAAPDTQLAATWAKAVETYFVGTDDAQMIELLKTLDRFVRHRSVTGSMRQVLSFTLERLATNDVVLLRFADEGAHGGHWVLGVGIELMVGGAKSSPTGVWCLDSAEPAPTMAYVNARLDLVSPARGARYLRYRVPDGGMRLVTCKTAIALSVRR